MIEPPERLRKAVIQGNLPITKRLLSRFPELWLNVDPNHKGWCNLHYASYHGNYLVCFHLISFINQNIRGLKNETYSATKDMITFDEMTVLHLPLINHHSQTLHYLLQEFPGNLWLNYPGGTLKQTPLHYACIYGFKEGVTLLLEFGADYKIKDSNGNTCLHLCFQYGHFDCLKVIIKFLLSNNLNNLYHNESVKNLNKDNLVSNFEKFESIKNSNGWCAIDYSSSFQLSNDYSNFKSEVITNLSNAPSNTDISSLIANHITDPSTTTSNMSGHPSASSSASSSLYHWNNINKSQTSILENKVLSSPIVPVIQSTQQQTLNLTRSLSHNPQKKLSKSSSISNSINQSNGSSINDVKIDSKVDKTKKGRAHSQSLPTTTPFPDISSSNEESQDDSELIKNLSNDKINVRKRANTSYNYERPSPITIFPHSSFTSPRSPQTPTSIQTPLTKTPSLKSFTISPLVRTNKDLNEKEDVNTHVSPQSAISVNSPILSSSGRKKSNTSLNHIFTSNSNSHKSLENTINNWPKVEEVDSIADSGADRQLQSIPLEDLELLPAPPPRKQSLPGSPVLQPPAKTTKTPELPGTPSKTGSRRSSVSASSQAARIAFQSSRSPSTDHHQSSRRPSLGQISTLQRRFSSGSPSPGSGGSPLLRKTRSTNEVAVNSPSSSSSRPSSGPSSRTSSRTSSIRSPSSTNSNSPLLEPQKQLKRQSLLRRSSSISTLDSDDSTASTIQNHGVGDDTLTATPTLLLNSLPSSRHRSTDLVNHLPLIPSQSASSVSFNRVR